MTSPLVMAQAFLFEKRVILINTKDEQWSSKYLIKQFAK